MATRIGTSFADLINFLEAALGGLKEATTDTAQKGYATEIGKILPELRKLDDR